MNFGTMYPSYIGGKTHNEIHGSCIAAWITGGGYFTYHKKNQDADCVCCRAFHDPMDQTIGEDNWMHYVSGKCRKIEGKFGYFWINMLEVLIQGPYHPIQDLDWMKNPKTKLQFITDPNHRGLQELRLKCSDPRFPEVMAINRCYLWAVHDYRSRKDSGMKIKGILEVVKFKKRNLKKQRSKLNFPKPIDKSD